MFVFVYVGKGTARKKGANSPSILVSSGYYIYFSRETYTVLLRVDHLGHRRRIKTEEKAKVVAAVWRTQFIQFLAALAILHQDDLNHIILVQFILFLISSW